MLQPHVSAEFANSSSKNSAIDLDVSGCVSVILYVLAYICNFIIFGEVFVLIKY